MRSFTMKRLLVFLGFSLVGVLLSFADALQVEQGVVIVMFMLVGFVGSLVIEDRQSTRFPIIMDSLGEMEFCIQIELSTGITLLPPQLAALASTDASERCLREKLGELQESGE